MMKQEKSFKIILKLLKKSYLIKKKLLTEEKSKHDFCKTRKESFKVKYK